MKWHKENDKYYTKRLNEYVLLEVREELCFIVKKGTERWFGYVIISDITGGVCFDVDSTRGSIIKEKAMEKTIKFLKKLF